MNYKKSILSVVLWFIYAIIVGTGMVGTAMAVTLPAYGALIITGVWLAVTGLAVFLLHRFLEKTKHPFSEDGQQIKLIAESLLVVALIAAGIVLRTGEIMRYDLSAGGGNIWFDTVMVTENTQIPQVVHGAVYFYLQVLHGLLVFFGNKMTAALILQVILQILSGIFLYFALRKMSGAVTAVVTFAYWMLCPVISEVVILGPETLYILLWMIGLCITAESLDHFVQSGAEPGIRSVIGFFFAGVATGVLGYLDVMGFLLLLPIFSVIFLVTQEKIRLARKIGAAILGIVGSLAGFLLSIALDAVGSGKMMENVLAAWGKVYLPENFVLPVTIENDNAITIAVVAILGIGVFGFWCRKSLERQSVWLVIALSLGGMICYGMTSAEMQGFTLLYLIIAVVAGAGVQAVLPYELTQQNALQQVRGAVEEPTVETKPKKRQLKIQDLEEEGLPAETDNKVQLIENPLPVPKKHVPKVLDYKLNDDVSDFDYPVADDDDFDH